MRRMFLLMALIVPMVARADDTSPVCARPAVVDRVATLLREAGRAVELVVGSVGERSAGTDRLVHCAMRGTVVGYDTNQHGMQPIDATFVVQYTLELRQNGIFLRLDE